MPGHRVNQHKIIYVVQKYQISSICRYHCLDYKLRKDACEPEYDDFKDMTEECWYTCTDGECTEPAGNEQVRDDK